MRIRQGLRLLRTMGPAWGLYRAGYALREKTRLLRRRFPSGSWDATPLSKLMAEGAPSGPDEYRAFRERSRARFFFEAGQLPEAALLKKLVGADGCRQAISTADDYCHGRFLYYGRHRFDLGRPPNWLLNPFTGGQHEARTHWCDYPTFSAALGDIKDVWEPSRFAAAYWLVRAYALTRDEQYPSAFWELFESWLRQNPPNLGPNWKCGQETALRTMAWCFALFAFWECPATTAERVGKMLKAIALQAERIAGNIGFAVSQKNNHGLSEAVGLLSVGLLFPELRPARRWEAVGRRTLEREVRRQIYDDGSYVQHSMNYHRVMLHDCLWAIRLTALNGRPLSSGLCRSVARAGEFLHAMLDLPSGRVPNHGANDGALVLPLSSGDYADYRPTLQAAGWTASGRRVLPPGPWDEMTLWLGGVEAVVDAGSGPSSTHERPVPHREGGGGAPEPTFPTAGSTASRRFDAGGYYTLRAGDTWCLVRCHTYRDRPAHVDMLHVDLWHRGVNVLGDSGTYRYFVAGDPAFERYFKDIGAHNTIQLDDTGPLELVSRFLWLPWPRTRCLAHRADFWQGEHDAYDRAPWHVIHRRTVEAVEPRRWRIRDELFGHGSHRIRLRWHLADGVVRVDPSSRCARADLPCGRVTVSIDGPASLRLEVARGVRTADSVSGWESLYYGECAARPTLEAAGFCQLPVQLVTRIDLGEGVGT